MKNVLFILTDDQRYNTIHALGNRDIHTPNLDTLVENGTAFTGAHIPSGTSGAICMPSRAMLNCGRSLFHIEGEGGNIPPCHTTMAEVFRAAGYDCFGTGKWHNGPPAFARGFTCGDNIFLGGMWDHWNVPVSYFDPSGEYDNEINFVANFAQNNQPTAVNCDKFNPGVHSTELLTETAARYLRERDQTSPFYLYLSYLAPHDPRTMPDEFKNMYDPAALTLPDNFMTAHPFLFGVEDIRDETLAAYPRNEKEIRRHLAEYYGMISHLDHEIGRLIQILKETGQYENTVIVFTGDNGLAVGSHGLMGKQNHYDHSIRVPLIFSGPGIPKNEQRDQYVYLMDIMPTLCQMLGFPIPASVEGKSFLPAFGDAQAPGRDSLFFAYNDMLRSVKDRRYKLIEYRRTANRTQLFDLQKDPSELHDLSADPAYEKEISRLRGLLLEYRKTWEDSGHGFSHNFWEAF